VTKNKEIQVSVLKMVAIQTEMEREAQFHFLIITLTLPSLPELLRLHQTYWFIVFKIAGLKIK
jgi:hypothetical protein